MKWFITGGSGFTGRFLIPFLQEIHQDAKICVLDSNNPQFTLPKSTIFHKIDLLNREKLNELIIKERPERIIHLAGVMRNEDPILMTKINTLTCGNLLDVLISNNISIDGLLVVGSSAQYGKINPKFPPAEIDECIPTSLYGHTKNLQEKIALYYYENYKIPVICVRTANLIGPTQPSSFLLPRILNQIESNVQNTKQIRLFSTKAGRDFIDIRDAVKAYIKLFESNKTRGEVFNISTNELTLIDDVLNIIKEILGIKDLKIIEEFPREDYDLHIINSNKIKQFIDWEPKISLRDSLKDMIAEIRS